MGLSGPAQTSRMNGTDDINGISTDGKTMFVTPVEIANPAEREIEKKKELQNRFQRWFRNAISRPCFRSGRAGKNADLLLPSISP